ncbi:MAG: metallophosphoesterase [Gemmatimonadota bacterium]|nr:metallophosphoesterase [Gemmatimonadota bacterium]MDH4350878.1 metallophosphoesterase [Gemmatimonadota bacterium]MDH5197222.1 metallophosphoesterase [Gemmatimonadota bacterium]
MTISLVHLSDVHFGGVADLAQIEAVEALVPDLEPDAIVISGDLTQRARHGEFQRARAFVRELARAGTVYVIPGNHDVQWWRRPFIPFGPSAKYRKYRQYFGPQLTPTLDLPGVVMCGVLTSHGVAWGSLTPRLRDIAVKGHLPRSEIDRAATAFAAARPDQARVLVLHHNVLRGDLSRRMGLARWRVAQRRIVDSGADVVLCGHDHQEQVDTFGGTVIACAGTLSTRSRGGRPAVFFRVLIEEEAIHVEQYRWDAARRVFRHSDRHQFARRRGTTHS